ncbi:MAG: hypothetical protein A3D44_03035 [Candidatus Staskawiczbacteria bacterium RIFCSPHIGHO2_02_FULL_42_22]|uniref:Methyltransferase type 11 domain-containing protein n=1 Tax=Candidatus Staskawiczbacteria bacterium RIFCSPHIGHO2_02_FULL_42_22 TaxID=1802207 RepID=A0A1G2I732_9BACT|nr:MAG: hypothetical protein A3D44_03035 [Candidatus Staskawiczbacteria bacterium RIFCSPHIGHO2_02_FULL_42_22]
MGLLRRHLYLLAAEHKKYPMTGDVLTLGQQSVHAPLNEVMSLFKQQDVFLKELPAGFDTKNKIPDWKGTKYGHYTNCQAVAMLLGAQKVYAADVSTYENPDIVMDFSLPVDKKYYNAFDVILDVGTLEHIFDISTALENIRLMTKPGGIIILGTWTSGAINHGFYQICPTLFYDYFTKNSFDDINCFMLVGSALNYEKKAAIYQCKKPAMIQDLTFNSKTGIETMFFARKKVSSTENPKMQSPIQSYYLASPYWNRSPIPSKTKSPVKEIIAWLVFITRKWRPEFIDMIWKAIKTKKNLIYRGRY